MKTCSSRPCVHGLTYGKSTHKISDRLWSADRSRLYLILNKNWCVYSMIKLMIFDGFNIWKRHLRAVVNESQNLLWSFHIISGLLKSFNGKSGDRGGAERRVEWEAGSSLRQCKKDPSVWSISSEFAKFSLNGHPVPGTIFISTGPLSLLKPCFSNCPFLLKQREMWDF
jgi:hypothetical protein